MEKSFYMQMIELGATIVSIDTYASRGKTYGRMWDGESTLLFNGIKLQFKLWHHGGYEETTESLKNHFCLKHVNGEDINWHCLIAVQGLFFHKSGWFPTDEKKLLLGKNSLVKRQGNPNFNRPYYNKEEVKELKKLGFKCLIPLEIEI